MVPSLELTRAFEQVMKGDATAAQIAALLMALRVKGETPEEVAAVVRAMRSVMVRLPAEEPEALVDTCGTGGGSLVTFNISTAAALLAQSTAVIVAVMRPRRLSLGALSWRSPTSRRESMSRAESASSRRCAKVSSLSNPSAYAAVSVRAIHRRESPARRTA